MVFGIRYGVRCVDSQGDCVKSRGRKWVDRTENRILVEFSRA